MNFLLSNIEAALDERHLLVGEKLFEEAKVSQLFEGQRNLWVAKVDSFEVEMQISPSRVRAASCECGVFLENKMCGHIAAGLFALRRHFSEIKKGKKQPPKKKAKTYHKLTTSAILENVKPEELKAFVGKYAKQNRNFALALSTRFASAVPLSDNHEKYRHLLHQLAQGIRKKDHKISVAGLKQFLKTCHELINQSKDAFALEHFTETWAILNSLALYLPFIIRNMETENEELMGVGHQIFSEIGQLVAHPIPPELKNEIWRFLLAEAPKKSFRTADLAVYFLELLSRLSDDESKKEAFLDMLVDNWKYRSLLSEKHQSAILAYVVELIEKPKFISQKNEMEETFFGAFHDFNRAVKTAEKLGQYKHAETLLKKGTAIFTSKLFSEKIRQMNFELAVKKGDKKKVFNLGQSLFLEMGEMDILNKMRAHSNGNWGKKISKIIHELKKMPSNKTIHLLPQIYVGENMLDELQDFLLSHNSIELTMQYDHCFLPDKKEELFILYRALLDDYMSQHFGEKPSRYLLKILGHLRKIGAHDIVEKIVPFVRKKYPRRMELAIELMSV